MSVPQPIVTNRVSGYDWGAPLPAGGWNGNGQSYGWQTHQGVDYGTPAGSAVTAPFDGVAKFETGLLGYGNKLTLTLANGWSFIFGHVASGVSGPVKAGQKIGSTGSGIGSSTGAVTLVEVHNPSGSAVNPHTFLDPIFAGTASALSLFGAGGAGTTTTMSATNPCAGLTAGSIEWIKCLNANPKWVADTMANNPPVTPPGGTKGKAGVAQSIWDQLVAGSKLQASNPFDSIGPAITSGLQGVLPTTAHVYRAFFVGLGLVLVGVGALIYFKGDEIKTGVADAGRAAVAT